MDNPVVVFGGVCFLGGIAVSILALLAQRKLERLRMRHRAHMDHARWLARFGATQAQYQAQYQAQRFEEEDDRSQDTRQVVLDDQGRECYVIRQPSVTVSDGTSVRVSRLVPVEKP